jgi:hypothetical protein
MSWQDDALLQASATEMLFTVTTGDISVQVTEAIQGIEPGTCTINYDRMLEKLALFPKKADLLIEWKTGTITITWGGLTETVTEGKPRQQLPPPKSVPQVRTYYEEERFESYRGNDKRLKRLKVVSTYEVIQVHRQQLTVLREELLAMVERVAFAVATTNPVKTLYRAICTTVKEFSRVRFLKLYLMPLPVCVCWL